MELTELKNRIENWVKKVEFEIQIENQEQFKSLARNRKPVLKITYGRKNAKIVSHDYMIKTGETISGSVWGFISLVDEPHLGKFVGDLLKPASWNTPAKHSRGNILNGTAGYSMYGPHYLN